MTDQLKPTTTYDEQIEKLCARGCLVKDKIFCKEILSRINYYRFTAYFLPFRNKNDDNYLPGTNFETIYQIYEFDRNMRSIIFKAIEEVEIYLRAKFAYYHAHKFGAMGYIDEVNYNTFHKHDQFIKRIEEEKDKNKKVLFVKHHIEKYNNQFPIWVITELFSFGMLSYFYHDLHAIDQKKLAKELFNTNLKNLKSWLRCCTDLRNICAHYGRLYFRIFTAIPSGIPEIDEKSNRRLYGAILALKKIYPDANKWNKEIFNSISDLLIQYSNVINLRHIGFPDNWQESLEKRSNKPFKPKISLLVSILCVTIKSFTA
ncbi:MAG: Abi family protein [Spirochaetes bacterium]|nr:Abi family protein [Spirochaetota bacterium]